MSKFIKQNDYHSCGPVALINLAKYYGVNAKYEDLSWIKKVCKTNKLYGTCFEDLEEACSYLFKEAISVDRFYKPSFSQIKNWVKCPNNSIIIAYAYKSFVWDAHFALISDYKSDTFVLHNVDKKSVSMWSRQKMCSRIYGKCGNKWNSVPWALFIRKN